MARLGTIAAPVPLAGEPAALELLRKNTIWQLDQPLDLYSRPLGTGLATQAAAGRCLRILDAAPSPGERLRVRLMEDGYPGWLAPTDLLGRARASAAPRLAGVQRHAIRARVERVLQFALAAMAEPNTYLWGGTVGPNYDCSGLVQTAYAQVGIWLPRDAYLQERFCQPVAVHAGITHLLEPGDLIFFGTPQRCTHVGLHLGGGRYLHSSGKEHGHNGMAIDDLSPRNEHPVASHYRRQLRGAGRVMHSHDGSPLPT